MGDFGGGEIDTVKRVQPLAKLFSTSEVIERRPNAEVLELDELSSEAITQRGILARRR